MKSLPLNNLSSPKLVNSLTVTGMWRRNGVRRDEGPAASETRKSPVNSQILTKIATWGGEECRGRSL